MFAALMNVVFFSPLELGAARPEHIKVGLSGSHTFRLRWSHPEEVAHPKGSRPGQEARAHIHLSLYDR